MTESKRSQGKVFGELYSPYQTKESTDLQSWYNKFKCDPERSIEINGLQYNKIISRCEFLYEDKFSFEVVCKIPKILRIGDTLVDEKGNEYIVKFFPHYHFSSIPEWYFEITPIIISGKTSDIGNYLAKKD